MKIEDLHLRKQQLFGLRNFAQHHKIISTDDVFEELKIETFLKGAAPHAVESYLLKWRGIGRGLVQILKDLFLEHGYTGGTCRMVMTAEEKRAWEEEQAKREQERFGLSDYGFKPMFIKALLRVKGDLPEIPHHSTKEDIDKYLIALAPLIVYKRLEWEDGVGVKSLQRLYEVLQKVGVTKEACPFMKDYEELV